jgi:GT2 family glycosyltransferase
MDLSRRDTPIVVFQKPDLTVVIPCLNAGGTIAVQLEALAAQRWSRSWEAVLCDNGSTDGSLQIAWQFRNKIPNFRIIEAHKRKGPSHARNAGMEAALSDKIAFCDADDEVGPGWVAAMGEALSSNQVVGGRILFDKFNTPEEDGKFSLMWQDGLYRKQLLPQASTCNMGIRREVHRAIGGFDESLPRFQDADYCLRLQSAGYKLHYVPEAVVQYRISRTSKSLADLFYRERTCMASDFWLYKRYKSLGMQRPDYKLRNLLFLLPRLAAKMCFSALADIESWKQWKMNFTMHSGRLVGYLQGRFTTPRSKLPDTREKSRLESGSDSILRNR